MDTIRMMMELELLKRSLDNHYFITSRKIEDMLEMLKENLKEERKDGC